MKMFVDVVEVLIGVLYVDGGFLKVLQCIFVFIIELSWCDILVGRDMMFCVVRKDDRNLGVVVLVQEMIGYEFKMILLLLEVLMYGLYIVDFEV